jgi:hypothetical protein
VRHRRGGGPRSRSPRPAADRGKHAGRVGSDGTMLAGDTPSRRSEWPTQGLPLPTTCSTCAPRDRAALRELEVVLGSGHDRAPQGIGVTDGWSCLEVGGGGGSVGRGSASASVRRKRAHDRRRPPLGGRAHGVKSRGSPSCQRRPRRRTLRHRPRSSGASELPERRGGRSRRWSPRSSPAAGC